MGLCALTGQEAGLSSVSHAPSWVSNTAGSSLEPRGGGRIRDVTPAHPPPPAPCLLPKSGSLYHLLTGSRQLQASPSYSPQPGRAPELPRSQSAKEKPGIFSPTTRAAKGMSDPPGWQSGHNPTALLRNSHSFPHAQGILVKARRFKTTPANEACPVTQSTPGWKMNHD